MPSFAYCVDTEIAGKIRVDAFDAHARYVQNKIAGIAFAAPLATADLDVVAGEDSIVASLFGVTASVADLKAVMAGDPYFEQEAWNPIEIYTSLSAAGPWVQRNIASGPSCGRLYAAFFGEADAQLPMTLATGLAGDLRLAANLQICDVLGAAARVAHWRAIAIFAAPDLANARRLIMDQNIVGGASAKVLAVPKSAGFWVGGFSAADVAAEIKRLGKAPADA